MTPSRHGSELEPWEYTLRKYLLMLATLVTAATYAVGFNPPGGAWQDTDDVAGHLAGEPITRANNYGRYLVFFYCNAIAFTSSVLVIILFLLLSILMLEKKESIWIRIKPLRALMVLDLLSFMGAYAAGSCRDTLTTIYSSVLMAAAVFTYLIVQMVLAWCPGHEDGGSPGVLEVEERLRKVLMLLATFVVSVTYAAGLSSPGGFWDNTKGGHRAGDAILKDHYNARLTTFFVCNTMAFIASLLIIMLLLGRKVRERTVRSCEMYGCIVVALVGLVGSYAAGSCREAGATAYVVAVVAAGLVCIELHAFLPPREGIDQEIQDNDRYCHQEIQDNDSQPSVVVGISKVEQLKLLDSEQRHYSGSLLLLLTTFSTAITYQAGLDPPGGVWQDNGDGHLAGDPILLTTNASRYRTFFYCNSFAFVSSLVSIIAFLLKLLTKVHVVETVMILESFGLIGAYAAGSCRDISTSIYVMALPGAILLYVVIHFIFFTLDTEDKDYFDEMLKLEKKRKLLYLLATLSTAMTYQAGLTPPVGFWLQDNESGHHAGDPVLLYNHPRHYKAFFYCNSVSFMLSITIMILLVNKNLYRAANGNHALTLCTVAGLCGLLGAFAAGSTQHRTISVSMFVLVAVTFLILVLLIVLVRSTISDEEEPTWTVRTNHEERVMDHQERVMKDQERVRKDMNAQGKYLMLLGILVAGVTYQAGLDSPGGVWQSDGHDAGSPVMQDNRRQRYLTFFYGNSSSFAASIVVILLLLQWLKRKEGLHNIRLMRVIVSLDLLALLVAYAAGSGRDWKSSVLVAALVIPVLTYIAINQKVQMLPAQHMQMHDSRETVCI